jgi:hypothetical protein
MALYFDRSCCFPPSILHYIMAFMEGDLLRAWKRLKKKHGWDDTENITAEIRAMMIRIASVPLGMAEEMADFYLPEPVDEDAIYKSEEILELLAGSWVPDNSILEDDDWDFIREQINAWALDMDMDVVTDVMKAVVENGGFTEKK